MGKDTYYMTNIADISDKDFFSSIKPLNGSLKKVLTAYKKKDIKKAYSLLSEYHKAALVHEWDYEQKRVSEIADWKEPRKKACTDHPFTSR